MARTICPVKVACLEAPANNVDAKALVKASRSKVIEDHPNGLIRDQSCLAEWHGYIETVNHHVIEGSVIAATGRRPML
jgi:hypothetical protein